LAKPYLFGALFLAAADALVSGAARFGGFETPAMLTFLEGVWLVLSIVAVWWFLREGIWPGAPLASLVATSVVVLVSIMNVSSLDTAAADMPAYWWGLRILLACAAVVACARTFGRLGTDESDAAPPGFPAALAATLGIAGVVYALASAGFDAARARSGPLASAPSVRAAPAPRASTPAERTRRLWVRGVVSRPDGVKLVYVNVEVAFDRPAALEGQPTSKLRVSTGRDGRYTFPTVDVPGTTGYVVTFQTPGYRVKSIRQEDAGSSDGEFNVSLSPDVS